MFPVEYRSQQPYSIAEGACSHPSSSESLFSWQPDPAQTHSLQRSGDVLMGQNDLILGQRGNLPVLEWYLRKLLSDWNGLLTRSWSEVGTDIRESLPGTLMLDVARRGAVLGMGWLRIQPPLISMGKGGPCFKAEFACWVESGSWSCWDHSCVFQPGSPPPSPAASWPSQRPWHGEHVAARAAELSQLCSSCSLSPARVNKYLEFQLHYLARTISFFHVLCSL